MNITAHDIWFLALAYYAVRMTTIRCAGFGLIEAWMLRVSAMLFLVSVILTDEDYIVMSNGRPVIGFFGLFLFGLALGLSALKTSLVNKVKRNTVARKPLYTWDMVIIGIIAVFSFLILQMLETF